MLKLNGIIPSITTPFDHHGDLYKAKLRHNLEKWNELSLTGYVVGGVAGESAYLTAEEKIELWGLAAACTAPGRVLIADVSAESVREAVSLANRAADLGYQAALVSAPHHYPHLTSSPAARQLYFGAVADQARLPLIIGNCPEAARGGIEPETISRLSGHPNIIAVKDSFSDIESLKHLLGAAKKGFQVLAGGALTLAVSLQAGAPGAVLAYAAAAPNTAITIYEAVRTREWDAALDWQQRISRAAHLVTAAYGIPGLKYAMDLNGYYGGPCRLPLSPLTPAAKAEIEQAFADLKG